MNTIALKQGQIWMDCDKRKPDRFVYINSLSDFHAQCINIETGKSSKVRRTAFKQAANGYILAYDPEIAARIQTKIVGAGFTLLNNVANRHKDLVSLYTQMYQISQRKRKNGLTYYRQSRSSKNKATGF